MYKILITKIYKAWNNIYILYTTQIIKHTTPVHPDINRLKMQRFTTQILGTKYYFFFGRSKFCHYNQY